MTKLELSHFRHIMRRQDYLEKMIMLGKNRRWQEKMKTKYEMD